MCDKHEILSEPIFCNDRITIGNKPILYRRWVEKDVYSIKHLTDERGNFLSYQAVKNKYDVNIDFVSFNGCIKAIKTYINLNRRNKTDLSPSTYDTNKTLRIIRIIQNGARPYYDKILSNACIPNCCFHWDKRINRNVDWHVIFKAMANIKDIKLKWLQIRVLHRILATRVILFHMGLEEDDVCSLCRDDKENIQHIFLEV